MEFLITEINGIRVSHPADMDIVEVQEYLRDELQRGVKGRINGMEIRLATESEMVNINVSYDTITRVRRITGYLSTIPKFNDAKRAEEHARVAHFNFK